MLEFNLKKKQARKELYYKKNNFVAELGIEMINKKTDLILHKPNSSILFIKRSAYTPAGLGKNGAPKHVEKVVPIDSVEPTSVDPTFAV